MTRVRGAAESAAELFGAAPGVELEVGGQFGQQVTFVCFDVAGVAAGDLDAAQDADLGCLRVEVVNDILVGGPVLLVGPGCRPVCFGAFCRLPLGAAWARGVDRFGLGVDGRRRGGTGQDLMCAGGVGGADEPAVLEHGEQPPDLVGGGAQPPLQLRGVSGSRFHH